MRTAMLAAATFALALAGCTSAAGDVDVLQSERGVARGASVAWAPLRASEMQNGDPRIDNDIIRQRIRTAVERALAARGHGFVQDPADAQYLVSYHVGLLNRQDLRVDAMGPSMSAVCGWRGCLSGYGWGMYGAPTDVRTLRYVEGTVMLDLTERATGQLAWRATSQRRVDADDATQDNLNAALADMTRSLP